MKNLTELQEKVLNQLGYDELNQEAAQTLKDVLQYGIDGGFTGFIYYSETCAFFDDNKNLILSELEEETNMLGEDMLTMISNFNCLTDNNRKPQYTATEIMNAIYNADDENETTIKNALSWAAAEMVAWQLEEEIDKVLNEEE